MKKNFSVTLLLITGLFFILSLRSLALEPTDEIKLYLGEFSMIPVSNPKRIVIGNPTVADVTNVTTSEMTLTAKGIGKTTLVFWDNFGEYSYTVKVFAEDTAEIKRRIDSLLEGLNLPGVFTKSSDEEGKVLLLGTIKSDKDREKINAALGILKDKTVDLLEIKEEESAVDIDVQVLELDKDATVTLGLSWPGSLNLIEKGSPGISSAGTKFSSLFKVVNLQRGTASATDPFSFTLNALVQEGKARILSRPRLACQSGKEAELLVGGEKPILTTTVAGTTGGEGTNVQYKEYGIKLNIKPTVMEENRIKLALKVEVSEVETAVTLGNPDQPTARAYPLTKRTASTELFVNDNQTIAIGGLIKQKNEEDMRKTPFLGDIPVLGVLFRKKTTTIGGGEGERGNKELFITLTPQIVGAEREPKITAISSGAPLDALTAYKELIRKRILENISYPPLAREIGLKGTVKLSLHLSFNGQLLEAKVKESSGYKLLDDEAINAAEVIGFYPPFPSSIDLEELWLDIPIVYKLN